MNVKILMKTGFVAAALFAINFLPTQPAEAANARRDPYGAVRFYDQYGQDRGYAWCLRRGGRQWSGWADCSYFSYAQCRASIIGPWGGDCEPNPWAAYGAAPPGSLRR